MEELIGINDAAKCLGVCADTLRNWDKWGKLVAIKTAGGHRRYKVSEILDFQNKEVLVYWTVQCVNKKTQEFFDRTLKLDWLLVKESDRKFLCLKNDRDYKKRDLFVKKFRKCFVEISEIPHSVDKSKVECFGLINYFEDENNDVVSVIELSRILSTWSNSKYEITK